MKPTLIVTLIVFFICPELVRAQAVNPWSGIQDSLGKLSSVIWKQKTDSASLAASNLFFAKFQSVLETKSSPSQPFDSLPGITRAVSEDGKIRIFTWNVPLASGANQYFGFIQLIRDSSIVIPLQSTEIELSGFDTRLIYPHLWYGAVYYKLIPVKIGNKVVYTVLGWDGYTAGSNRKIIDIVSMDDNGNVVFGMPVFKTGQGIRSRILLEYAEKSSMLLRYDYQAIKVQKGKKIKRENTWLIVMDRLVPMDPSMEGFKQYYVPAGDVYDGFIFRKGNWILVEDIEVANK